MANLLQSCFGTMACSPIICGTNYVKGVNVYGTSFVCSAGTICADTCVRGAVACVTSCINIAGTHHQALLANSSNSLTIRNSQGTNHGGLVLQGSANAHGMQLYWSGGSYGFLDGAWAGWDIRKDVNGSMCIWTGSSGFFCNMEGAVFAATCLSAPVVCATNQICSDGNLTVKGNVIYHCGGSPEFRWGTASTHVNWRMAVQETISNAWEIGSGLVDADVSNDTFTRHLWVGTNYICGSCCFTAPVLCATSIAKADTCLYSPVVCSANSYTSGWFRNTVSGAGLYNSATGQHFYSDHDDYWNIGGGTVENGLRFRDEAGTTIRGTIWSNNSNQIGFQDSGGNVRILVNTTTDIRLCNTTCVYGTLMGNGIIFAASCVKSPMICATSGIQLRQTSNGWGAGLCFCSENGANNAMLHMDNSTTYDLMLSSAFYVVGHLCSDTCVKTPIVYGTTCVQSPMVFPTSCLQFDQTGTRSWKVCASSGNLNFHSGDGSGAFCFHSQVHSNLLCATTCVHTRSLRGCGITGTADPVLCIQNGSGSHSGPAIRVCSANSGNTICTTGTGGSGCFYVTSSYNANPIVCTTGCVKAPIVCATTFLYAAGSWIGSANLLCGATCFHVDTDSKLTFKNAGTNAIAMYADSGDELYLGSNNAAGGTVRFPSAGGLEASSGVIKGPIVCATSCVKLGDAVNLSQFNGTGTRLKICGTGDNYAYFGPNNDDSWTYIVSINNSAGMYFGTNQGNFQFDTGHLGSYTNQEVDIGYPSHQFRCGSFSCNIYGKVICATTCVRSETGFHQPIYTAWTGEANKIQWHSCRMYFQNTCDTGCFHFRNSVGTNVVSICAGTGSLCSSSCLCSPVICGTSCVAAANVYGTTYMYAPTVCGGCLSVSNSTDNKGIAIGEAYANEGSWNSQLNMLGSAHAIMRIKKSSGTTADDAQCLYMSVHVNNPARIYSTGNLAIFASGGVKLCMTAAQTCVTGALNVTTVGCANTCLQSPVVCATTAVRAPVMCAPDFCALSWFRNADSGEGLYNVTNDNHFHSAGEEYWHINSKSGSTYGALIFYDRHNSAAGTATGRRGYVYWDGTNNFGLLTCGGSWAVRIIGDSSMMLCKPTCAVGAFNASSTICATTCLCSPIVCATGTSGYTLRTAGCIYSNSHIVAAGDVVSSGYTVCSTSCVKAPIVCATSGFDSCTSTRYMLANSCRLYFNTLGGTPGFLGGDVKMCMRLMNTAGSADVGYVKFITDSSGLFSISVNSTSTTANRLCISTGGAVTIPGSLSKGSGSFLIPHPDPEKEATMNLSHSFVESPTGGDNIYRWKVSTQNCKTIIELPSYYKHLNKDDMVWASPYRHFGSAYGEVTADQCCVTICSNEDGEYNILLIGTRKDKYVTHWNGVETAR